MLRIHNLSSSFHTTEVLKNVNLEVNKGTVFGILGKNGAGKTTFFDCIYQNKKYAGTILFSESKISRTHISYLETENYFYPYITGNEYLNFFSSNTVDFKQLSTAFNLPLNKYVQDYSSGMKKKLALLGMLLLDKPINILDEPFNGVDFEGVNQVYEIIDNLKSKQKIILISSHVIETLFRTCDKIGILNNGSIEYVYSKTDFHLLENFKF